jgi:GT2 family glycosyltransferase
MIRVAVSILNHNSAESTIACVQSLLRPDQMESLGCHLEIVVADNASGENDRLQLQQSLAAIPNVHLRMNSENLGFAAGHNRNLKMIFAIMSAEYVWLLNSDCLVDEDTLPSLIKCAAQQPDVGIWGATMLESDGQTIQCAGGCFYNSWISSYRQYGRGIALAQIGQLKPVDYDYIAGASLFFPARMLQRGLLSVSHLPGEQCIDSEQWLNERFFLYFEELDLAHRLKPGIGMAWCKGALIKHFGGASTGAFGNKSTKIAEFYSTLSALEFTYIYYPHRLWVMAPVRIFSKCVQLLVRGDLHLIGSLFRAYRVFFGSRYTKRNDQ